MLPAVISITDNYIVVTDKQEWKEFRTLSVYIKNQILYPQG